MPKPGEVAANWHVVDATGQVLGRLAARVSLIIQGKHKPTFTRHVDTGDFVVIINADKVKVTAARRRCSSTRPTRANPAPEDLLVRGMLHSSEKLIELAVRRMIPKNKMGRNILGS